MARTVLAALGLRPGETLRTFVFFANIAVCSAIYVAGKTVRDTLFLSAFAIEQLPWMFVAYGVVSLFIGTHYSRLAQRTRADRLIVWTSMLGIVSYLGVWGAARAHWTWVYPIFYIWAEIVGFLFVSQFWNYANELHSSRDAKRLFGLIGAGRVLGFVVCGLGISSIARRIGTENIILVTAGMMFLVVFFAWGIRARLAPRPGLAAPQPTTTGLLAHPAAQTKEGVLAGRYAKLLAAVILLMYLVCQLADYQFKHLAKDAYQGDALAAYFGQLYAAIGGFAFILQFFFTGKILATFGLMAALLLMPAALFGSSLLLFVVPGIVVASLLKFSDNAFQYSIQEATTQLLYFPFPAGAKARIRGVIDGMIKPAGYLGAGAILLGFAHSLSVAGLNVFTLPLLLVWVAAVWLLCREYVKALATTLRDRRLRHGHGQDGVEMDRLTGSSLMELVADPEEETALFAMQYLRRTSPASLAPSLGKLLSNPHRKIRGEALELLEEFPRAELAAAVEARLGAAEPVTTRVAAVGAWCALRGEEAIERVLPMATDDEERLRVAVLAAVMKHCGLDGVLCCGPRLQSLLGSEREHDRRVAAKVLGKIGVRHFYRQLIPLMADPSNRVRREAVRAARTVLNPKLLPSLLRLLGRDDASAAAEKTLGQYGDVAVPSLEAMLGEAATSREAAISATRTLRRIGTLQALHALASNTQHEDERVRRKVLAATSRLHRALGQPAVFSRRTLEERLLLEMRRCYQLLADRNVLLTAYPGYLVGNTFQHDLLRAHDRVWSLLNLAFGAEVIGKCERSLQSGNPAQRSNALEVLDNTVWAELKRPLIGLLEAESLADPLEKGRQFFQLDAITPEGWLETQLASSRGGWHRIVALDAIGRHVLKGLAHHARAALADPIPLVREVAMWAVVQTLGPESREVLKVLENDPAPAIRRLREHYLARLEGRESPGGHAVLTTIEEVIFMHHIPIFEGVPAEHLVTLAELTEEVFAAAGQEIVRQGERGESLFIIIRGRVEILVEGRQVGTLGEKECFGEMALIDGETRSATVRALEATDLLMLGHDEFHEFLEERAEVSANVLKILCQRIRALDAQLSLLYSHPQAAPAAEGGEGEKEAKAQ